MRGAAIARVTFPFREETVTAVSLMLASVPRTGAFAESEGEEVEAVAESEPVVEEVSFPLEQPSAATAATRSVGVKYLRIICIPESGEVSRADQPLASRKLHSMDHPHAPTAGLCRRS